jgi:cardiolipin synthase
MSPEHAATGNDVDDDRETGAIERAVAAVTGVAATTGNSIEILRNGDEIFPAMLEAIDAAERSVDLLTFVYWTGEIAREFADHLASSARRGVRVRVLLDAVGAKPMDDDLIETMESAGVDVERFRPPDPRHPLTATHRTHRKVMICDETVGFTGGVGIADEWLGDGRHEGSWRDTHVRIEGPAVTGLRGAFIDNWIETRRGIFDPDVDLFPALGSPGTSTAHVVKGSSEPGWNDISVTVRTLIDLARHCIRITTAYFVPDDDLADRLVAACERGVEVEILLPGPHADKRFVQLAGEERYRELLDAGAAIHCYQPSMLHAKIMTIDGIVSVIGSANFNHRSTHLDEEVNMVVFDREVTAAFDVDFDADLEHSEELNGERWRRRSVPQRVKEQAMHVLRPWL